MANISTLLSKIMSAIYGEEVRSSIHDAIDEINNEVINIAESKADTDDVYTKTEIDSKLNQKQESLTFDDTPVSGSNNPVTSDGIKQALDSKADSSDVYTKGETVSQINSKISNVYKINGSSGRAQLNYMGRNTSDFTHPKIGDVYNLIDGGDVGSVFSFEELGIEDGVISFTSANTIKMVLDAENMSTIYEYIVSGTFTCIILENLPLNDYEIDSIQPGLTLTITLKESVPNYSSAVPAGLSKVISVEEGDNLVWTDVGWDKLSATVDLSNYQEKLTFDSAPTEDSVNPVTSGGVKSALDEKADADDVYTKEETDLQISSKLGNVYKYKGSVNDFAFLNEDDVAYNVASVAGNVYNYVGNKAEFVMPLGKHDTYYNIPIYEAAEAYFIVSLDTSMLFKTGEMIFVSSSDSTGDITVTGISYVTHQNEKRAKITYTSNGIVVTESSNLGFQATVELDYGDNVAVIDLNGKPYLDKLASNIDLSGYQEKLTFDSTPTEGSSNPVTSDGVKTALDEKVNVKIPTNGGATSVNGGSVFASIYSIGSGDLASLYFGSKGGEPETGADSLEVPSYGLTTALLGKKQDTLPVGTASQYYRGDSTLGDFDDATRSTVLTGVSFNNENAITALDTFIVAIGKLQAQITMGQINYNGDSGSFWSGEGSWGNFDNTVRATVLTGLDLSQMTEITATDTVLNAFGKLQSQLSSKANSSDVYTKAEIDSMIGDIEDAADGIIALQESYIGGDAT